MRVSAALMLPMLLAATTAAWCADAITPTNTAIRLFNGRNLDGLVTWLKDAKREDPRHVFTVERGMLHISGDGLGYIRTRERYRNYHLVVEFRWGGKTWAPRADRARDSGVIVHCTEPDGSYSGIFMAGIEAQMIEGGTGDFIVCSGKRADGSPIVSSLTAEVTKDRDGETVWHAGGGCPHAARRPRELVRPRPRLERCRRLPWPRGPRKSAGAMEPAGSDLRRPANPTAAQRSPVQ